MVVRVYKYFQDITLVCEKKKNSLISLSIYVLCGNINIIYLSRSNNMIRSYLTLDYHHVILYIVDDIQASV